MTLVVSKACGGGGDDYGALVHAAETLALASKILDDENDIHEMLFVRSLWGNII